MKKLLLLVLALVFASLPVNAYAAGPGASVYSNTAGVTTTLIQVKTGTFILCGYNAANPSTNTGQVFIQFFDAASTAGITLGTTHPLFSLAIPASGGVIDGLQSFGPGFINGVVIAVTTTAGGSTAPTTAVPVTLFFN